MSNKKLDAAQRLLELEQQKTLSLLNQLALEKEKHDVEKGELIDLIAEAHAAETHFQDALVKRMAEKNARLTRQLIREQAVKENISGSVTGYSNPAKLMNHLKMKKAIANSEFRDVNQYVSHMEAFTRLSNKKAEGEVQR